MANKSDLSENICFTYSQNIVELLKSKWNLIKIEDYTHKVWYCERSGCRVETIISTQWFVKVDEMAKKFNIDTKSL